MLGLTIGRVPMIAHHIHRLMATSTHTHTHTHTHTRTPGWYLFDFAALCLSRCWLRYLYLNAAKAYSRGLTFRSARVVPRLPPWPVLGVTLESTECGSLRRHGLGCPRPAQDTCLQCEAVPSAGMFSFVCWR